MNEVLRKLTAAYAEHGTGGVRSDPPFQALCASHREASGFDAALNLVSDLAAQLEEMLHGLLPRDQAIMALKLFNSVKEHPERREACAELTRRRYAVEWSEEQREYYEQAIAKLVSWRDYFLSFTNYNPTEGEILYVNGQHRELIQYGLGRFRQPDTMEKNLLAHLLEHRLRNAPLDGYFYPRHREPGDVCERLQAEARASFAFVQLLQSSIFQKSPNYCLLEFDAACEDDSRLLLFVMPGPRDDFVDRHAIDNSMRHWHDRIMKAEVVEIEQVTGKRRAKAMLDFIDERVVRPVQAARKQLLEGVPA